MTRITIDDITIQTTTEQDEGLAYMAARAVAGLGSTPAPSHKELLAKVLTDYLDAAAAAEDVDEIATEKERYAAKYAAADAAKRAELKAAIDAKADAGK